MITGLLNLINNAQVSAAATVTTLPSLNLKKTNAQVIADTITWAKWIAADNSFHYGHTNKSKNINAHHNGCYFCGTNKTTGGRSKKGIVDYKKTYCCNPFVHAAWAHGGCIPEALSICRKGSSWGFSASEGYNKSKLFKNLGHPAKSKLKPGDVLCSNSHVALYIGDGKIAEAAGGDDNKRNSTKWNNSIHIAKLTDSRYRRFKRVHRYIGSVNTTMAMRHGEVSNRIKLLQAALNKSYGKTVVKVDGKFGDSTLKVVKQFQKANGITANGVVGSATIKALGKTTKTVKKTTPTTTTTTTKKTKTIQDKILAASKTQAEWMKNYTYKWESKPTITKSKKKGTCVTYVACVLQRVGILASGSYIWHNEKGKVTHANSRMSISYPGGTLNSNKSKLKAGDIIIAGNKKDTGSGSHIFIFAGKWDKNGNPYIWDNHSAERIKKGKKGLHTYSKDKKVVAIIRIKK